MVDVALHRRFCKQIVPSFCFLYTRTSFLSIFSIALLRCSGRLQKLICSVKIGEGLQVPSDLLTLSLASVVVLTGTTGGLGSLVAPIFVVVLHIPTASLRLVATLSSAVCKPIFLLLFKLGLEAFEFERAENFFDTLFYLLVDLAVLGFKSLILLCLCQTIVASQLSTTLSLLYLSF